MSRNGNDTDENPLASIFGKLEVTLGRVADQVSRAKRVQQAASRFNQPVFYPFGDQVLIANTTGVIRLTGPDQGHMWYIRGIGIWNAAVGVEGAMAGKADLFVSGSDLRGKTITQFSPIDWRDTFQALPTIRQYSAGQIALRMNEEAFIVFTGATNGQTYGAHLWVEDFEEAAIQQAWSL